MRDVLLEFGEATLASADSYCANTLNFERKQASGKSDNTRVVFVATVACVGFTPTVYDSADGTAFTPVMSGQQVNLAVGQKVELPLPLDHKAYLKAGGKATSGKVIAFITLG